MEGPEGPIELSARAFDILCLLLGKPGQVLGKDEILAAAWPGVVVEENTLQVHISALRKALEPSIVMTVHGRGYKYAGPTPVSTQASKGLPPQQEIGRPSIAVVPFASLSIDPEQGYFADGIVDELITGLSRLTWLTVISRSSTFVFKDRPVDARQVGLELGVRYVLEGTVRRAEDRVRITGQLIDAVTGLSIWGAHFDGSLDNIFELQDQVTMKVIGAIQPRLEQAELEKSRRKPTSSLDAYDHYLRGLAEVHRWTREANREALKNFYKAIELDRRFAPAYGMAARCLSQRKTSGWVEDEARERSEAEGLASLAVELGPDDPVALATAGLALAFVVGRVREGGELIERSLAINPGHAVTWMFSSWVKAWSGEAEEAIAHVRRAMELSSQRSLCRRHAAG